MIIFGIRSAHIHSEPINGATCPSCGSQGTLSIHVYRNHAHVFWVPMFPIEKKGFSQCQHCKNVLEPKEMPNAIKAEFEQVKSNSKGPIWQFSGLGLFAILIAVAVYANNENSKLDLEYLQTPQVGDVYEYKIESGRYSTLKVVEVAGDSVFVSPNDYEINKRTKLDEIDKAENYGELSYSISTKELKEMYDSGEIFDVNR